MKGSISEEALLHYNRMVAEKQGMDFAEGEVYDFTTCIRPDGSAYGTSGTCRKGTKGEAKKKSAAPTGSNGINSAPVAPVPPKSAMTKRDPVASVLKSQQELKDFNKKENARLAEMIKAGKVKGVTAADLERIKANRGRG